MEKCELMLAEGIVALVIPDHDHAHGLITNQQGGPNEAAGPFVRVLDVKQLELRRDIVVQQQGLAGAQHVLHHTLTTPHRRDMAALPLVNNKRKLQQIVFAIMHRQEHRAGMERLMQLGVQHIG